MNIMLSSIEAFFVRLLRGTVVATAFASIAAAVISLLFAGYAQFYPDPRPRLSQHVSQFRNATDPAKLIANLFPADTDLVKKASEQSNASRYTFRDASTSEIFEEFNKFLDIFLGGRFESSKQFEDWLFGSDGIELSWSKIIDDKDATNEDNVNVLWRSLLFDYAVRLQGNASALADARKAKLFASSFDKFTAPTGRARSPYFLSWYFYSLQDALKNASDNFVSERAKREELRSLVPAALYSALAAFSYFIFIMFLFLVISIEASLRRGAERAGDPQIQTKTSDIAATPPTGVI